MATAYILIVDDDPGMLQALPEILRRQLPGIQVSTSNSPRKALEQVEAFDYDAIISDINMPGMNGLVLLAEIRERRKDTPILLMTAHDDRELVVQALRGGAYDFVQKPLDRDYVVASLQRAIQMRRLSRQVAEQKLALERHAEQLEQAVQAAIAEAQAAQRRLAFLADASTLLASSLDYETTLSRVARLAVLYLADFCIVDLVQEDGKLHCVGLAHVDRTQEVLVRNMRESYEADENESYPPLRVLQDGQSALYAELSDETLVVATLDAEQKRSLHALHPRSVMFVPLIANERTLGVLTFALTSTERLYGPDDLALAEDLTRRAALAVDNARLYEEAQRALQVREQFLSVASHELNTPITSMLGYAQLLQRRAVQNDNLSERDKQMLNTIINQARRLHQLNLSLLDNSRIDAGQLTILRNPVDICALVQRVLDDVLLTVQRHTINFCQIEGPLYVEGDEMRLEQVLQNLVQNAIKYSPNGGTVNLSMERIHDQVMIAINDQGIGIPAAALPRIFTRFFRANNAGQWKISGMGVGLYVVKEIVTLHGGTIEVTSTEGVGSTFTIYLPLMKPEDVKQKEAPVLLAG